MKKTIVLMSLLCIALTSVSFAQKKAKPYNGSITFTLTYSGDIDAATIAQQPKEITVKILGNKARTEISYGPATIVNIANGDSKSTVTLIDVMGQKYAMRMKTEDVEKDLLETKYDIKYIDSTKTIAGFVCKKAVFTVKSKDDDTETIIPVWYTEELGGDLLNYGGQFHGLKGFALEYEMTAKGIKTVTTTKEIKKGKVSENDFLVPSDYKEVTKEEMKKMFSGGGEDE